MDNIFKQFSPDAKNILFSAQKIASSLGKPIDTNHILLAMTTEKSTLAYEILKAERPNIDKIYLALNLDIRGAKSGSKAELSKEAKEFLKDSLNTAKKYNHFRVGSEHFLLTLLTETKKKYKGYQTLVESGIKTEKIKNEIEELFNESEKLEKMEEMLFADEGFEGEVMGGPGMDSSQRTKVLKRKKKRTPALDFFSDDLTAKAKKGELDPVIGRKTEIERVIQILNRRTKNNPVLLGDPGVGKTAIVEGLAQRIAEGDIPASLTNMRVLSLDLSLLVAGTKYRGEFEERIKKVMDEIMSAENIILFVDEIHSVVGVGSAEGSMDAANILKPALAKGKIRLIGATTLEEYRKFIEKDAALERRLQTVLVEEPKTNEVKEILNGLRTRYEKYHHVKITDEAIDSAIELSKRYINDRFLPDKAIDIIDEAASRISLSEQSKGNNKKIKKKKKIMEEIIRQKDKAVEVQTYEKASALRKKEKELKKEIELLIKKAKEESKKKRVVDKEEVAAVVSFWSGVPVTTLLKDEIAKFKGLEKKIKKRIVGQDEAVKAVVAAIKKSRMGVGSPERPIGSFIFLGPTGVGKTELAKVLALNLFDDKDAIVKIDMSEFMEKHNISRLVGAPPGYVGFEEGGKLTEAIRRRPYSIVLLDEIEKAHPDVQHILLQILEDGYITDAAGKRVNFRNTVIIITSNIGTESLSREAAVGFRLSGSGREAFEEKFKELEKDIRSDLEEHFRPEFLNRLDKIIVFKPLQEKDIEKIVEIGLRDLKNRLKKTNKIDLKVKRSVLKKIAQEGFDPKLGARPVRRKISEWIEDPLSEEILKGKFKEGDKVTVELVKEKTVFKKQKSSS